MKISELSRQFPGGQYSKDALFVSYVYERRELDEYLIARYPKPDIVPNL